MHELQRAGRRYGDEVPSLQELWEKYWALTREQRNGNMACMIWTPKTYRVHLPSDDGSRRVYPHQFHYYLVNGHLPSRLRKECDTPLCCNSAHYNEHGPQQVKTGGRAFHP